METSRSGIEMGGYLEILIMSTAKKLDFNNSGIWTAPSKLIMRLSMANALGLLA